MRLESGPRNSLVTSLHLRGEQGAAKCSDQNTHNQSHPTYTKGSSDNIEKRDWEKKSLGHSWKISLWILKREKELGIQLGCRLISEGNLDIDEFCACFIVWQKAFDHVNWTILLQIMIETGMDWRDSILIRK